MKVLFIDVDGTLVDYENRLPESAAIAIKKTRAKGNKVYLCTGRSEGEIYDYIRAVGFDGMIGGNGCYVRDGEEILLHQKLTKQQCHDVVEWCNKRQLAFYLESNSGLYGSDKFREKAVPALQAYSGNRKSPEDIFPDMIIGGELVRDDVNKISFMLDSYQDYLDAKELFSDLEAGTWGGIGDKALFGDLGAKNVNKKTATEMLLKHLKVNPEDAYAFGDAKVDIPLFEICGTSIAMGSGSEECRKAADYVTTATDQDGLYNAFEHFGLL